MWLVLLACALGGATAASAPSPASLPMRNVEGRAAVRILLSHTQTLAQLRNQLARRAAPAVRFKTLVDDELAGAKAYAFKPWFAALLARVTDDESYCRFAVQGTEAHVAAEEALIGAGRQPTVAEDSYLQVGPLIGNLALVYDWCRISLTEAQRGRWVAYANQAVWNVWNPRQARWGSRAMAWTGWSVDNPVNNYYYSFLEATMLLGLATEGENTLAPRWLEIFRKLKLEDQLFPVFNRDLAGGGSREGTGYGTAMKNLFRLFDWWERSTGERIATRSPHALASMAHLMHAVVPTLDRLTPTGDHARDSTAALFDYHREYLLVLARLFPGERLAGVARSLLEQSSVPRMRAGFNFFVDYLYDATDGAAVPLATLATAYWASGTGQFSTRSSWSRDAAYANFVCGPYTEGHAHRDQGSFTIYKGAWLAYDANIESHSGIEQAEAMHNLVRMEVGGATVAQRIGAPQCQMLALADEPGFSYAAARVTPVYRGHAAVDQVEREFLFVKPGVFVVFDRARARAAGVRRVWTLNLPAEPTIVGDTLSLRQGEHRLDVIRLAPRGLRAQATAWPSVAPGLHGGVRVDVPDANGYESLFLHVLSTDGAMLKAVRADVPGSMGAQITLAGGEVALVRFGVASAGGSLEIRDAAGAVVTSGALPTSVKAPPLFVR